MTTMSTTDDTTDFDEDLSEELFNLSTATDGDVVEAEIIGVEKTTPNRIDVEVRLPNGETFTERMEFPKDDTETWKFVRLARSCGYSLASAKHMTGDVVQTRYEDGSWSTVAPRSRRARARDRAELVLATLATPVWLPWGLYLNTKNGRLCDDSINYAAFSTLALAMWWLVVILGLILYDAVVGLP